MWIFYDIAIRLMSAGISIAGLFNPKARKWSNGRKNLFKRLKQSIDPNADIAWFHAASLGEFEQGRPVIEAFKKKNPHYKILLTFFSPSGYEVRKNYSEADYIFYLPVDTRANAKQFISIVKPKIAVFIKYEFWANYLKYLSASKTHIFIISTIFRSDSTFFKWYAGSYRKLLSYFEHIFVQDENSQVLLAEIGVTNVSIAGDTRFDRVEAIAKNAKKLPLVESFAANSRVFIAGSTWNPDEELLLQLINNHNDTKFIIAPHEIENDRIEKFIALTSRKTVRYTKLSETEDISNAEILFIDTIGILSSVYHYGNYAYIGGGFGVGIHNILEAATFGLPLVFGPNYLKFKEARDLVSLGGAVSINSYEDLNKWFEMLKENYPEYNIPGLRCSDYVRNGCGATEIIMSKL